MSNVINVDLLNYINRIRTESLEFRKTSIATQFGDLRPIESISKKLPLVSDQCVFFEKLKKEADVDQVKIGSANYTGVHSVTRITSYFRTNDLEGINAWFERSLGMISSGRISYLPYVCQKGFSDEEDPEELSISKHWDESRVVIEPPKLFRAMTEFDVKVSNSDAVPLFTLEIPGLDNLTPSQLSQLMDDHPDKLLTFRNYLQQKLLGFEAKLHSERFGRELRLMELDIQDGLRKLTDDIRRLKRTTLIEAIGAEAVTWTLFVLVFLNSPDNLLKIVLPGGAIATAAKAWAKFVGEKDSLKTSPFYFLYLISRRSKSL